MDKPVHQQPQDDLDVQITDLPGGPGKATPPRSGVRARFTARQRKLQLAAMISLIALALLMLGSYTPMRSMTALALFGPTPTPTPMVASGSDRYLIQVDQAWGKLYLDGHLLTHIPLLNGDDPLQLARGTHEFVWQASPFPPRRCTISVPPLSGDTCPFILIAIGPGTIIKLLSFQDTLNDLLAAQASALTRQIQAKLDALQRSEVVRPGEYYVHDIPTGIQGNVTDQPLRATLHYRLDTKPSSNLCIMLNLCQIDGEECATLCTVPKQQASSWEAGAVVQTLWDYTTLDGSDVANGPDAMAGAAGYEHLVTLYITWDGANWQVSLDPENPLESYVNNLTCASAEDDIAQNPQLVGQWRLVPASNAAAGCLALATVYENDGGLSSPSHPIVAYCLHRFGVFLAANDAAHRLWPFMPLADAYEKALAAQLATMPGWTFSVPANP